MIGGLSPGAMSLLADLPFYAVYAASGSSAAALAKASIGRWRQGQRGPAIGRFAAALAALAASFALLVFLLGRADLSEMAPVAIGLNLVIGALLAVIVFGERLGAARLGGLALILAGILLIELG